MIDEFLKNINYITALLFLRLLVSVASYRFSVNMFGFSTL